HLGVVEPAVDQRLYDVAYLTVCDAPGDLAAVALPALDPVDVVPAQPVPLGPPVGAVFAHERADERDVIAAQRPAAGRHRGEVGFELGLLAAEEPDGLHEDARVPAVGDDDLDLAGRVRAQPRHHPELQQQLLYLAGQADAARGVRDLDRVPGQDRRRPVAFEQRLQERPLDRWRGPPHEVRHALACAPLTGEVGEHARAQRVEPLDVQFVQHAAGPDAPAADGPGT